MVYPSKKEFISLSGKGNLIPVYTEMMADFETPLSAYMKIDRGSYSFLLESVEGGERIARYSFLGSEPSLIFSSEGNEVTLREGKAVRKMMVEDPIDELKKVFGSYKVVDVPMALPRFYGGFVGYMGYDMVRFMEKLPDKNIDDLKVPDSLFMMTDTMLIFDHVDHKIKIVSNAHVQDDPAKAYDEAVDKIDRIVKELKEASSDKKYASPKHKRRALKFRSNFTRKEFESAVRKAKEYIRAGDIIQVVLSQRLETQIKCHPFQIYRALRSINPSPYMYYLKMGDFSLVGSSPEVMVRCEDGRVELRPIAGTRRRGKTDAEDEKLIEELLADPKERAEHIMLVDLGRNDVGRVCDFKTVKVSELMTIEKYSHVMHIVSDVSGTLSKGKDVFDVIRATFPAGTVSGAPKVRAMEIIDSLENRRRKTYAGSVGYFSFSGNLDCCITIRTMLIKDGVAYIQAGGGDVADSIPRREYEETMNKARALIKAIEKAEEGL